jgi:hypothetical protein
VAEPLIAGSTSLSNASGGGADDTRRGLPVYATIRQTIDIAHLNAARPADGNGNRLSSLGIDGTGTATLQNALVDVQKWGTPNNPDSYGGVIGLACRYGYSRSDGSVGVFTLYVEYLHLITPTYLPKDGQGKIISADTWAATGKGIGFGPRIQQGAQLPATELAGDPPILVGYLGATQFPHVHIQASFADGAQGYVKAPRIDPTIVIEESRAVTAASQSLASSVSRRNGFPYIHSFRYEHPSSVVTAQSVWSVAQNPAAAVIAGIEVADAAQIGLAAVAIAQAQVAASQERSP